MCMIVTQHQHAHGKRAQAKNNTHTQTHTDTHTHTHEHTLLSEDVVARNAPGVTKALVIPSEATAAAAVTFIVMCACFHS